MINDQLSHWLMEVNSQGRAGRLTRTVIDSENFLITQHEPHLGTKGQIWHT